ncbi:ABC transporter permease [Sulfitobacter sp. EhC04]|uniref:branched-chain amino acid ABC transporter permease n=1 Tax=Sulfitobacter sp. EhC04 TaxID=1849168 RepID=UPI0007F392A6|nr:branched-chain amino acid ABC transporter permease [Sulfitobacter sp. EhC04]OAN67641.1 ABC transporter permease [Sulfitobacter sp. EhC04]
MTDYSIRPIPQFDRAIIAGAGMAFVVFGLLPMFGSALVVDKLTMLFIYIILAVTWNLLAGYAGLVSVGHQAFVGLGAYMMLRMVEAGVPPFIAIVAGGAVIALIAWPMAAFVLRLRAGEFAIAMWVLAETIRSLVMLDPYIQGETGRSLVVLNAYDPDMRRNTIYLMALVLAGAVIVISYRLLHGRLGGETQAIRDDEEAAGSVGVSTFRVKRIIFVLSAVGCALAGTLWLASAITFQPRTAFGIQWSVFMLFMVLVGGLGSILGPILGAVLFMTLQVIFGDFGVWYLAGLGIVAMLFALHVPRGIVGLLSEKMGREPITMQKLLNPKRT